MLLKKENSLKRIKLIAQDSNILLLFFVYSVAFFISNSYSNEVEKLDEIIVTADSIDREEKNPFIITSEKIKEKQSNILINSLKTITSLNISSYGNNGKLSDVTLRGAPPNRTLIIIDDTVTSTNIPGLNSNIFNNLMNDGIEKIEIVPNTYGALYGYSTVGGLIYIKTKKSKYNSLNLDVEKGSYNTSKLSSSFSVKDNNCSNYTNVTYYETGTGIRKNEIYGNIVSDKYSNASIYSHGLVHLNPFMRLESSLFYSNSKTKIDDVFNANLPVYSNNFSKSNITFFNIKNIIKNSNKHMISFSRNSSQITTIDKFKYFNKGINKEIKYTFIPKLKGNKIYLCFNYFNEENHFPEKKSIHHVSCSLRHSTNIKENVFLKTGFVLSKSNLFPVDFSYAINPSYELGTLTLDFKFGVGFKTPSLLQIYGNNYTRSSKNLKPERSKSWDISVKKRIFNDRVIFSITYFSMIIENIISMKQIEQNIYQFRNVSKRMSRGIENSFYFDILKNINLSLNYTWLDAYDQSINQFPVRLPKNKISMNLNYYLNTKTSFFLDIIYKDKQKDFNHFVFPSRIVKLSSSINTIIGVNHKIGEKLLIFGRIENAFNKKFEDVYGYGTRGFSLFGGFSIKI